MIGLCHCTISKQHTNRPDITLRFIENLHPPDFSEAAL
jgi:hypothetical protein